MNIVDQLEALLFVASSPVRITELAQCIKFDDGQATEGQVEQALEILEQRLADSGSIQLVRIGGGFQLSTKSEYAELIGDFLKPQRHKLSRSVLEVLAIVAYKQPVTTAEVEEVRGVQSDYGMRVLQERNLVREVGRKQAPGRPVLYGTTAQFLHQFNINDIKELPSLELDALPAVAGSSETQEP